MKYHWIGGLVRPLHPVQISASKVKSAPAIQNHHHHHPAFEVDWQETAHQGDSGPTSASTHASLSLRLQGSQAGKQRPPGLPGLFVCLAWILEAAGIWSVWPQPSCSLCMTCRNVLGVGVSCTSCLGFPEFLVQREQRLPRPSQLYRVPDSNCLNVSSGSWFTLGFSTYWLNGFRELN